ncbi:apolipoprotein N-acyltransferase [Leifsonia flava]|uniref:Apolipoprotein N-acyltransferase n=1 Tax=Orlajensenia leifsoniae TaxID=2561933 RepID=A0A4Y9R6H9_9MICO|nr:apolipoprotein N-acyltransferase [Leifsonia flava]TFV99136.1 apolipoprotein N-acyltransferase [Leifsonia flava]
MHLGVPTQRATPLVPFWGAILLAAGSGYLLDAAFPDRGWWPLAPVAMLLLLVALRGRSFGTGLLVGLVSGSVFWLVQIIWLTRYLGPVPWLALGILQAIFFAIGCAMIAVVLGWGPAVWPTRLGRLGMLPIVVAGLWTAREGFTAVAPYGGFAWGRLALSQSESPFTDLAAWLGMAGLSFVIAWIAAFAFFLILETDAAALRRVGAIVAAIAVLVVLPAWPTIVSGTTTVAAVQGNADAGLFANRPAGEILMDHVAATLPVQGEDVDMVVWPENASDVDPTRSAQAAQMLDEVATALDAPLVAGTVTERDGLYYNTSFLWEPGQGIVDYYDKGHPVPFAEYMPDRTFWRPFAPDLIDLVGRDYQMGKTDGVFDIDGVIAGISICFDIADDQLISNLMGQGAQIILAQTNNADFGTAEQPTDESAQQLAIARIRAVETGRTVVNISTVGESAIVAPDGSTIDSLPAFTAGAMVQEVPLSDTTTPAMVIGRGLEWLVSGLGLAGLVLACIAAGRARRIRRSAAR